MNSEPKLYKNLVAAVILALEEIVHQHKYADKVLEKVLKSNPKWGARDRAFIAETVYDIVRHRRLLSALAQHFSPEANLQNCVGIYLLQQGYRIPDWSEFKDVQALDSLRINEYLESVSSPAILQSYPDWLYTRFSEELGIEVWKKEAIALNQQAHVFLRVNTLNVHPQKLITLLKEEGIETEQVPPHAYTLKLKRRQNVFRSKYFKQGYFEVQDWSSQQVSTLLGVEPGMRVVDTCAGAGGKTLHLAALMKNKGRIIALDTEQWKLKNLMERARRAGITIIETRWIDSSKVIKRLHDSADRVLMDVPCSGLGVLRRNPDTKWKLTEENLERTRVIQQDILQQYSPIIHAKGQMVYATCSILPSENEQQTADFRERNPSFNLIESKTIYPSVSDADGFYMALLGR